MNPTRQARGRPRRRSSSWPSPLQHSCRRNLRIGGPARHRSRPHPDTDGMAQCRSPRASWPPAATPCGRPLTHPALTVVADIPSGWYGVPSRAMAGPLGPGAPNGTRHHRCSRSMDHSATRAVGTSDGLWSARPAGRRRPSDRRRSISPTPCSRRMHTAPGRNRARSRSAAYEGLRDGDLGGDGRCRPCDMRQGRGRHRPVPRVLGQGRRLVCTGQESTTGSCTSWTSTEPDWSSSETATTKRPSPTLKQVSPSSSRSSSRRSPAPHDVRIGHLVELTAVEPPRHLCAGRRDAEVLAQRLGATRDRPPVTGSRASPARARSPRTAP